MSVVVKFKKLHPDASIPKQETPGAAGMDLVACLPEMGKILINPGEKAMIPTQLAVEIPPGFEGQCRPRSGIAAKNGITVLNSPGTIDCDYRGHMQVLLVNHSDQIYAVEHGMRIAQLVICVVPEVSVVEADELSSTHRGDGGWGSTGTR